MSDSVLIDEIASLKNQYHVKIERSEIKIKERLGSGNFANVYKGVWRGCPVAVKKFLKKVSEDNFIKELLYLSTIRHPGLVQYMGYSKDEEEMWLVMELMEEGSLFSLLHDRKLSLNWNIKISMALDVASAMEFLHSFNIRHLDLNSKNLLLNKAYKVKVADLGLAERIEKSDTSNRRVGQMRWMAPEVFKRDCKSLEKSDVWSFANILFEIGTGCLPYHDKVEKDVSYCLQRGIPPEIPKSTPSTSKGFKSHPALQTLMTSCWVKDHQKRPTFKEIRKTLQKEKLKNQ